MPFSSTSGKRYVTRALTRLTPSSVLDIGAGSGTYSDLYRESCPAKWTAIEIWEPYVEKYGLRDKYDEVIIQDARVHGEFPEADVAIVGDVLEHMTKSEAIFLVHRLLQKCRVVIASIPIVHYPQGEYEGNPYEAHVKDDWSDFEVRETWSNEIKHGWVENEIGVYILSNEELPELDLKIAVYTICKNEEQFVGRFMNSAKEADGVFVLDTGSTDRTVELLRSEGAYVEVGYVMPWRFDVARNMSLQLVPLDYDVCISIDLDEVLTPGWASAIKNSWELGKTTHMRYHYTWNTNWDGSPGTTFWYEKCHARDGFRWVKPVHEVLHTYNEEVWKDCPDFQLFHFPDHTKSRSSYLPLLEMGCREDPDDDRNSHYLGREYMFYGQYENAVRELTRHLSLPRAVWNAERCASMRFIARSLIQLKREPEALEWLRKACNEAPETREPWYELGKLCHAMKMWNEGRSALLNCIAIAERPAVYINEPEAWGTGPHDILSLCCWELKLYEEGKKHCASALAISPTDERILNNMCFFDKYLTGDARHG